MADSEKKDDIKLRIHLKGNKYIISNGECFYIVREDKVKKQNGKNKGDEYIRRTDLSGYCRDFEHLFDSYKWKSVRNSGIDGEIADLVKFIKDTNAEVRSWGRKWDKAWKESD